MVLSALRFLLGRGAPRLIAAILVAGCQPVPRPFADAQLPPDAAILAMPEAAGVMIGPVAGAPDPAARRLTETIAKALAAEEIPASTTAGNSHAARLRASAAATPAGADLVDIAIDWRLTRADGKELRADPQHVRLSTAAWQAGGAELAPLAEAEAKAVARTIEEPVPVDRGPMNTVVIGAVTGAPGDGGTALPKALAFVFDHDGIAVVPAQKGKGAVTITGAVTLKPLPATPQSGEQQDVTIVWHVRRADGGEVGIVSQENAVPAQSLDGAWSDVALAVASAARDELIGLINRARAGANGSEAGAP